MAIVIPYVKQTWTDGSGGGTPISAARLGVLEEGILDVSQAPCVRVTHNAAQSTTSGVTLALAFNTERFDQAAGVASTMHDTVTNNSRLTAVYAGIYQISGSVEWAGNATGRRDLFIRSSVGAAQIAYVTHSNLANVTIEQSITTLWSMAVNDYVELCVNQTSGGALNVNSSASYSPEFMMVRVG